VVLDVGGSNPLAHPNESAGQKAWPEQWPEALMVWIGGPRRDPSDRLGRGRRGLYLHDPPPGYHPPQPRMTLKDRQRIARQDWILEHVLAVILILSATAVIVIICLIIATHL
jgi:hypothetical protein